ncbi:fungal-specific transcription factor domain-containing protein [Penicillium lagena]|uniref:fungal-specific transcription factor domain-containing protein n=1 Tax=Penicillium lagena TaxID=94218 RepID=UPI00253FDA77|nr:fungal-specific transcription factor domain-containing protein [Penicillium lagena]KAJ5601192.1 fungal-specific transcription factor domain-containing protein [Penicillium lagena]
MTPRNRTLTGCSTCRARHLKCDETRPGCQMCRALGLLCPGYRPQLKWTQDLFQPESQIEENEDRVFRRPLFRGKISFDGKLAVHLTDLIENEQVSMTLMTIDSLGSHTADTALKSLDCMPENGSKTTALPNPSRFKGPFGVLNFVSNRASPDTNSESGVDQTRPRKSGELLWPTPDVTFAKEAAPGFQRPGLGNSTEPVYSLVEGSIIDDAISDRSLDPHVDDIVHHSPSQESAISPIPFFSTFSPTNCRLVPNRAPELLRYFKNNIVSLSLPLKGSRKCPWQTVHLPSAEKTYAQLILHETASHTSLSLFYSLLAASCLYLSARDKSSINWNKLGKAYKEIASKQLEYAIRQESTGSVRIKYKELLMGLLSMVMLEVWIYQESPVQVTEFDADTLVQIRCCQYNDAQNLLVEAECLIRRRGLPKPHKSLKVRVLHHVYAYLRIMAESTCGCALMNIRPERPSSSLLSAESSFHFLRSFRVTDHNPETDLNIDVEKSIEIGYNDIHLEVMGTWKESLFLEIYGVPEALMSLLSQTIRLANEQELLNHDSILDPDVVIYLNRRTKLLEHHILTWKPSEAPPDSPEERLVNTTRDLENTKAAYYAAMAVHQSLILFYYRRVHNINALILQDTVRKVIDFVRQSEQSTTEGDHHVPSLLWPCFVAACESLDLELQSQLLEWLLASGRRTSISSFTAAAKVVQNVWKFREETMDYTYSWFDVVNQDLCPIIAI